MAPPAGIRYSNGQRLRVKQREVQPAMNTEPKRDKPANRISLFAAASGMLVTFLLGIYVGVHPNWLPRFGASPDYSKPVDIPAGSSGAPRERPTTAPTGPTTAP